MITKQSLRQQMLKQRRLITEAECAHAANAVAQQILKLPAFIQAKRVGCYLAMGKELSLSVLMQHPLSHTKQYFAPTLPPFKSRMLLAAPFTPHVTLTTNALGFLAPPLPQKHIPWWTMDIMFIPLVAFDKRGARLGRGGGFYDVLLNHLKLFSKRPLVLGVAFDFQEVEVVPVEAHDAFMDGIITPTQFIYTHHN